jgi:hypothetical protein
MNKNLRSVLLLICVSGGREKLRCCALLYMNKGRKRAWYKTQMVLMKRPTRDCWNKRKRASQVLISLSYNLSYWGR